MSDRFLEQRINILCEIWKIITGDEKWRFQYVPESKTTKFAMETDDISTTQGNSHVKKKKNPEFLARRLDSPP
jgi:hypothetical protein